MEQTLLTPGEFARLARTTKRTVLWYAEKGILEPYTISEAGYRLYKPEQIIDFQGVLLMRKLGVPLEEIRAGMADKRSLQQLFKSQRSTIEQQIGTLQRLLRDTTQYYHNLDATGTLVEPIIKQTEPFDIYYIERVGPYASIGQYFTELQAMFTAVPADAVRLTIFLDDGYHPDNATMRIGIAQQPGLQPKASAPLQQATIPAYRALTYVHRGSTTLLSLLWQEVVRYRELHHLKPAHGLPFDSLELYQADSDRYADPEDPLITEIRLPIA
ncbi:MAG TPA: MerR family transcriptional regulator [Candidatus Saccharimonadales bacterium]|nr:MerR family transcriptional regulator [Candidatus Saccharimonadales bacterium]